MVALNFSMSVDEYKKIGRFIGQGCGGKVYAIGPFVVKIGPSIDIAEARNGRALNRLLPDNTVEVYKYRGCGRWYDAQDAILITAKADHPTLKTYLSRMRGRKRAGMCDAIMDEVNNAVAAKGWTWQDEHDENLMYGLRDGKPHWQLIDYDGLYKRT